MEQAKDQLKPQNYLGKYKDLIPSGSLDGLLGSALSKFDSVSKALQGGGGLSGLADNFF